MQPQALSRRPAILWSVTVFVVLALLVAGFSAWYRGRALADARAKMTHELAPYAQALSKSVSDRLAVQRALTEYVSTEKRAGIDEAEFDAFATGLRSSTRGLSSVYIAPAAVVTYVSPPEPSTGYKGRSLREDTQQSVKHDVERAIASSNVVASIPHELLTGKFGIMTFQAVRNADGSFWGLSGLEIEMAPLLEESGVVGASPGFDLALRDRNDTTIAGSDEVFRADPVTYPIEVAENGWTLAGAPTGGWSAAVGGLDWGFVLVVGVGLAFLAAVVFYRLATQQLRLRAEVESRTARMTEMNNRLARDLQSLRIAEETMRLSEERFRHLWEGSPLAAIGTQSSVITFANNAAAQLFGYESTNRIVGMAEVDLAARTERPEIASRTRNRLKGVEEPSSYETLGVRADGTEFPMRVDVVLIEQGDGSVVITFFTDMTERVRAEEALRDSASQYRALFENSPVSLWEEDFSAARKILAEIDVPLDELRDYLLENPEVLAKAAAGMVVQRVNRTTLELWHARSEADLTGGLDPYVVDANQELYALELVAIARGEQRFFGMAEIPTLDEHMMFANIYWTVAPGHEATYGKVFVSIIDLSDQRRMQLQLMRYKDSLEVLVEERTAELSQANTSLLEATKAKDKFLAAMSHELRTPLNSIIGFSGTMLQRLAGEINEEQERQLTLVQRSGRHLLMLINQVLDLSRIEAGQEHFEPEEFAVGPFVEELVDDVSGLAQDKGIAVKSDIAAAPESIVSDRDRLKQILLNLLSNGIKFTEEGEVSLSASVQGELIVFRVRDSGPGIPFDEQGNVFEAFHQIRTSAGHKPAGTGLGLSISRELATLLGGEISLESEPGNGSVFIVRIPRDAANEPLPGNTSSTVVAGSGDSRGPDVT